MKKILTLLLLIFAPCSLAGCQVIFAPFSIAEVEKNSKPRAVAGMVLSESGEPLNDLQLLIEFDRVEWHLTGLSYDYAQQNRTINSQFHEEVLGRISVVTISKSGYYSKRFRIREAAGAILEEEGLHPQPESPPQPQAALHIVLRKQENPTTLQKRMETLWVNAAGEGVVMNLSKSENAWDAALWTKSVDHAPPGYLYLTARRDADAIPTVPAIHREIYHTTQPAEIRLGIAPADGDQSSGILIYTPQNESNLWYEMRQAPATGYQREVILDAPTMQRLANNDVIWFFIKSGNLYGRGYLTDWSLRQGNNHGLSFYGARVFVSMQPDATRNLETRE